MEIRNSEQHLDWLGRRRSTRQFEDREVPREVLERVLQGAITAPSATNRQPWQFAVVTDPVMRGQIADAVQARAIEIRKIIAQGHHADEYANYGDFFHEPLAAAQVIIIPQYREYPDLIANLIKSGGGDPSNYHTASAMQAELCSTSAAVMTLLLQAHAEGLAGCWMAGPMIAKTRIEARLGIHAPWQMVGGIALGYPDEQPVAKPRKPLDKVVTWFEAK